MKKELMKPKELHGKTGKLITMLSMPFIATTSFYIVLAEIVAEHMTGREHRFNGLRALLFGSVCTTLTIAALITALKTIVGYDDAW